SGISVFFIQKLPICGFANGKSIPPFSGRLVRNISPRSCSASVRATSTSNRCVLPAIPIVSGIVAALSASLASRLHAAIGNASDRARAVNMARIGISFIRVVRGLIQPRFLVQRRQRRLVPRRDGENAARDRHAVPRAQKGGDLPLALLRIVARSHRKGPEPSPPRKTDRRRDGSA